MTVQSSDFSVRTPQREALVDITHEVAAIVTAAHVVNGTCVVYCPHTTAAIAVNENADPDVKRDLLYCLARLVPQLREFQHSEGNSDAHVKSSLVGPSLTFIVRNGRLLLGTWQGILFAEFDGPRTRTVQVLLQGE
jgi:secondary thiamine-phosphate synthase enzyme